MPAQISDKLLSWAPDADQLLLDQAGRLASLPFVKRVALMPDAHVGIGSSVGTVFATQTAIIPAAVGVDIGCGMIARRYPYNVDMLYDLDKLRDGIMGVVPTGMGNAHDTMDRDLKGMPQLMEADTLFSARQVNTMFDQFGTLGGGNHFIEVCQDAHEMLWLVIHSGSRGIGNQLAQTHISKAREATAVWMLDQFSEAIAKDKDLAFLVKGTPEFDAYIKDMRWAQAYAWGNRLAMLRRIEPVLAKSMGIHVSELTEDKAQWVLPGEAGVPFTVHCHHNYTTQEHHDGQNLWITRKGAISATAGEWGIVPGSMAAGTYITRGKGNAASFSSSSHGAGRVLSRKKARERFDADSLKAAMSDVHAWNDAYADDIRDEHPLAYKSLPDVMRCQEDLTDVVYQLRPLVNVKGKK